MAKKKGITGWHAMRKEELVKALLKLSKSTAKNRDARAQVANGRSSRVSGARAVVATRTKSSRGTAKAKADKPNSRITKLIREEESRREQLMDLAQTMSRAGRTNPVKDRVVLIVRDSYWLQAYWEITSTTVQRARVALGDGWHQAQPVIRVLEISEDNHSHAVERPVRDIPVHGGVKNWFIDVTDPPKSYRIALGYVAGSRFFLLAKSNTVATPIPGMDETVDNNWTDIAMNHEKYYSQSGGYGEQSGNADLRDVFEEKLRRPMTAPMFGQIGASAPGGASGFEFEVDVEMVVYGKADPQATVTLSGEPVRLQADGSFQVKMPLPARRQVLPVVACSRDGTRQRTTVIAIERNTKVMEPVDREYE